MPQAQFATELLAWYIAQRNQGETEQEAICGKAGEEKS